MPHDPKVLETLEALNRGYLLAGEKADVAWYDAHLAPDYMATNPDGSLVVWARRGGVGAGSAWPPMSAGAEG
jgi:hypothetical protein